jgi:hypothetical protein
MKASSLRSGSRLRLLRRRFVLLWLLFFLVAGLIFFLTLLNWRRFVQPARVASILPYWQTKV